MDNLRSTTRQISAEVFEELRASGRLEKRESHVLRVLYENYPKAMTAQEVTEKIREFDSTVKVNTVSNRFAPLRRAGLVGFVEKRKCTVSQTTAGAWKYLGGTITRPPQAKTHKERIIEVLKTYMAYDECQCSKLQRTCLKCLAAAVIENR